MDRLSTPSTRALVWWQHTSQVPAPVLVRILPTYTADTIVIDCKPRSAPVVDPQLPPTWYYKGPSVSNATPCQCSTVYYSVTSACAVCQDGEYLSSVSFLRRDEMLVDR